MSQSILNKNVDAQVTRLERFTAILNEIVRDPAVHTSSSAAHTVLMASILKMVSAGESVRILVDSCAVEEILAVGQSMLELAVNAAFLQYANVKEVERFLRFRPEMPTAVALPAPAEQRSTLSVLRRLRNSVKQNLPGKGKEEIASWSRLSLEDRARFTDEASNIPVMSLLVARCSSRGQAAVHGTMGSLDYFISVLTDQAAAQPESRLAALTEALFGVNLCLFTFSFYLSASFDLRRDRAIEEAANAQPLGLQRPQQTGGLR